ncbi:MAG: ceramidase domain-containing protein [Candidatus Lokiarchaeota archaeon]|nr:ceramidase domain-containing protein [Candidatus Lokiarchaeota archaeon]
MVAYIIAWSVIFMLFEALGWPGDIKKCVIRDDCFCEHYDPATLLGQPVNSITNLAYVFVGLAIMYHLIKESGSWECKTWPSPLPGSRLAGQISNKNGSRPFTTLTLESVFYTILVINIGISSFFMHASQRKWAGTFDTFCMNMFIVFVGLYSIAKALNWPSKGFFALYGVIEVIMLVLYLLPDMVKDNDVFAAITAMTVGWEVAWQIACHSIRVSRGARDTRVQERRDGRLLSLSIGLFLGGYLIWILEDTRIWPCDPLALFQPHGIWHVLTALATYAIFRYMRSGCTRVVVAAVKA